MQKKIIALAVAAVASGAAFAQTNVVISGTAAASYGQYKISGPNTLAVGANISTESRITDESSKVQLNGTEDLGNGLAAWFQIDSRYSADGFGGAANGTIGSGNTMVGLKGKWGSFGFGSWDMSYDAFGITGVESYVGDPLGARAGAGLMNQVNGVNAALPSRHQNQFKYDSPNLSGFSGTFAYSTNSAGNEGSGVSAAIGGTDPGSGNAWQLIGKFANGPITAFISTYKNTVEGRAAGALNSTSTRLGGAYTFPMGLKIGLGWDRSRVDNMVGITAAGAVVAAGTAGSTFSEQTRSAWMIPISYNFGAHNLYLTYAKANRTNNLLGGIDNSGKQIDLGYGYAMSKRTSLGAYYVRVDNTNPGGAVGAGGSYDMFGVGAGVSQRGTNTAAGQDATLFSLTMRHNF